MLTDFFLVLLISTEIGHLVWQNEKLIIIQSMKICTLSCIRIKKYKRVHSFQFISLLITIVISIWKAFLIFKFNLGLIRVKFSNNCNIRNSTLSFSSISQIFSSLKSISSCLNTYLISCIYASFYLFLFLFFPVINLVHLVPFPHYTWLLHNVSIQ